MGRRCAAPACAEGPASGPPRVLHFISRSLQGQANGTHRHALRIVGS
jgi:hypothetical protein